MDKTNGDFAEAWRKLKSAKKNWGLADDGAVIKTRSSLLQPVIYQGNPTMLKIPVSDEERRGCFLMIYWNGKCAARILRYDENAFLMERAIGTCPLKQLVLTGQEDKANKIICEVAAELHRASHQPVPELIPLPVWFKALKPAADKYGGLLVTCSETADELLSSPVDLVILHGDIHYDNILDAGARGWVAIDPKGLIGERGFDFANIFCNPTKEIAFSAERLSKQVQLIAKHAGLDPKRLVKWIIAWTGLSAAWTLDEGEDASLPLTVAEIAIKELDAF